MGTSMGLTTDEAKMSIFSWLAGDLASLKTLVLI
jgi:hypothetical protein